MSNFIKKVADRNGKMQSMNRFLLGLHIERQMKTNIRTMTVLLYLVGSKYSFSETLLLLQCSVMLNSPSVFFKDSFRGLLLASFFNLLFAFCFCQAAVQTKIGTQEHVCVPVALCFMVTCQVFCAKVSN